MTADGGGHVSAALRPIDGAEQIARYAADLAGVPLDNKPLSAVDRARWGAERREFERDLPAARYWRRGTGGARR